MATALRNHPSATCGCGTHADESGRKATAVDPDIKDRNLKRLRRIEGQVRGLQRMIDEDTYCIDVLTQISSVTKALQSVALGLLGEPGVNVLRLNLALDAAG